MLYMWKKQFTTAGRRAAKFKPVSCLYYISTLHCGFDSDSGSAPAEPNPDWGS